MTKTIEKDYETVERKREITTCNICKRRDDELDENEEFVRLSDKIHLCSRCIVELHPYDEEFDGIKTNELPNMIRVRPIEDKDMSRSTKFQSLVDLFTARTVRILLTLPISIFIIPFAVIDSNIPNDETTFYEGVLSGSLGAVLWCIAAGVVYTLL